MHPLDIAYLMRHASPRTTMIYNNPRREEIVRQMSAANPSKILAIAPSKAWERRIRTRVDKTFQWNRSGDPWRGTRHFQRDRSAGEGQGHRIKWRHYQGEIILLCVRWYLRYALSCRDLEEMMRERGLSIDHTTIGRWVQAHAPELEKRIRPHLRLTNAWRLQEQGVFFAMERDKFLFKNFPFFREKTKLQFRWEIYNLINHTLVRRWIMPHGFTAPTRKSAYTSAE